MGYRPTDMGRAIAPSAIYTYRVELDNYSPVPRAYGSGTVERFDFPDTDGRATTYVIETCDGMRDATRAVFLFDDGAQVVPLHVAGWQPDGWHVYAQPFPLSVGTRPDNGRPVDMSGWALGPRRAYHLKARQAPQVAL